MKVEPVPCRLFAAPFLPPRVENTPAVWRTLTPSERKAVKDAAHHRETRERLAALEWEAEARAIDAETEKTSRLRRLRASHYAEAKFAALKADLPRRRRARETLGAATEARAAVALSARELKARARAAKAGELVRRNRERIAKRTPEDTAAAVALERAERILAKARALRAARAPARRRARRT